MSEELLINVTPQETRVAAIENGVLQEVHIERTRQRGFLGNIYKGRVVRILPGMQAAFVDIGLDRTAFIHVMDVDTGAEHISDQINETGELPPIGEVLRDSQEIVVQIVKDPLGTKGARLSTQLAIPARSLVYIPHSSHIGVSQKIQNPEERERLRETVKSILVAREVTGGFIVRTVAEGMSDNGLGADIAFLEKVWRKIKAKINVAKSPALVHEDIPLPMRTMRDLVEERVEKVRIDSKETLQKAKKFAQELIPEVADRIEYYPGERPIFDLYSIEDEIQRALDKRVPLKSGGHLVIDQTEAMTTVDVNTGGFVGRRKLEETLFKTNLEATHAIARQLRLRNIGGIIIIDFIDMEDDEHRRQVLRALEKALSHDRVKTHITDMSPLGLVEITRKRSRESLEQLLCESCKACGGSGVLKTSETICYEIFREILREARQFDTKEYMVLASAVVIDRLLDEESASLADLQEFIGKPIHLQVEPAYNQESFDVVLL